MYDLTQHNPESVLRALHERLMEQCRRANPAAEVVAKSLVVLVAGGDGSLSWVLKAVRRSAHAATALSGSRCGLGARRAYLHWCFCGGAAKGRGGTVIVPAKPSRVLWVTPLSSDL